MQKHHITDIFPHLCPATPGGELPGMDFEQSKLFLELAKANGLSVMPWVGGVYQKHCFPAQKSWRDHFVQSITSRLSEYPQLDGIQLNIEPWPNGNRDLLNLLDELNAVIPENKILSIAAYPPPTRWQPAPEVHWDQTYYQQVASRADQMVVMMYDTSIKYAKPYELLMRQWTKEVLTWGAPTPTLLGLPAYDDADVPWHDPKVENLHHALRGINAGLADLNDMQRANYRGISVYCHWEMTDEKWQTLKMSSASDDTFKSRQLHHCVMLMTPTHTPACVGTFPKSNWSCDNSRPSTPPHH
ncbi:MAG: hypothetical protein CMJ19_06740 [Phycisphaeraceae bacterium]|nr:hypothetical protein [Phycisphaeraceae bacterium]